MFLKPVLPFLSLAALGACATADNVSVRADAAPASAAPATQSPAPAQIAGLHWKQGQRCTFEYNHNGKKAVRTETATSVDGNRVVLNLSGDGVNVDTIVEGDRVANGISIVDGQPLRFEPASKWIDYPVQPGSTWQDDKKVIGETFTADSKGMWKVAGWEKVKVPAGEYKALRVVLSENLQGQTKAGQGFSGTSTFSYWIAPEVNCPVKLEYRNSFGEKGTRVLRSAEMS